MRSSRIQTLDSYIQQKDRATLAEHFDMLPQLLELIRQTMETRFAICFAGGQSSFPIDTAQLKDPYTAQVQAFYLVWGNIQRKHFKDVRELDAFFQSIDKEMDALIRAAIGGGVLHDRKIRLLHAIAACYHPLAKLCFVLTQLRIWNGGGQAENFFNANAAVGKATQVSAIISSVHQTIIQQEADSVATQDALLQAGSNLEKLSRDINPLNSWQQIAYERDLAQWRDELESINNKIEGFRQRRQAIPQGMEQHQRNIVALQQTVSRHCNALRQVDNSWVEERVVANSDVDVAAIVLGEFLDIDLSTVQQEPPAELKAYIAELQSYNPNLSLQQQQLRQHVDEGLLSLQRLLTQYDACQQKVDAAQQDVVDKKQICDEAQRACEQSAQDGRQRLQDMQRQLQLVTSNAQKMWDIYQLVIFSIKQMQPAMRILADCCDEQDSFFFGKYWAMVAAEIKAPLLNLEQAIPCFLRCLEQKYAYLFGVSIRHVSRAEKQLQDEILYCQNFLLQLSKRAREFARGWQQFQEYVDRPRPSSIQALQGLYRGEQEFQQGLTLIYREQQSRLAALSQVKDLQRTQQQQTEQVQQLKKEVADYYVQRQRVVTRVQAAYMQRHHPTSTLPATQPGFWRRHGWKILLGGLLVAGIVVGSIFSFGAVAAVAAVAATVTVITGVTGTAAVAIGMTTIAVVAAAVGATLVGGACKIVDRVRTNLARKRGVELDANPTRLPMVSNNKPSTTGQVAYVLGYRPCPEPSETSRLLPVAGGGNTPSAMVRAPAMRQESNTNRP